MKSNWIKYVFIIFIVFFGINIAHDIIRQKKNK